MKFFKTEAKRTAQRYEISREKFIEVTDREYPFEQRNNNGELVQYGVCPSCHNPIQLIGIMDKFKTLPYGRHTGKNINGLPQWNYHKYVFCPFAKKGKISPSVDERLNEIDESVIELYHLMKLQFDRIVYIVENTLGIRCSSKFWTTALMQFVNSRAFCYPWLTEANLPYIFAYFGVQQQKLFGQYFLADTKLFTALKNFPGVKFGISNTPYKQLTNDGNTHLELYFRLTRHKNIVSDGETLKETMVFCIDDRAAGSTIYEEQIEFDETRFMNLVNKKGNENKRQQWLLDIAEKCMPSLLVDK